MSSRRIERLNDLIREEISDLLQRQVNDPRLRGFVSITRVSVTADLSQARVFVSVMGSEGQKREVLKGFAAAAGFLRRELGNRIRIRLIPELSFQLDKSIEAGEKVLDIMEHLPPESPPSL